jgi:hypothetical protein
MPAKLALLSFASLLALTGCAGTDSSDDPNGATSATSANVDAHVRADLKLALSIGARCQPQDAGCRTTVRDRVTRGDRTDAVLARVAGLVDRIDRADICAQTALVTGAEPVFVVGAEDAVAANEAAIVFDLAHFRAAVLTARDGLSVITSGPYEALAKGAAAFPQLWSGPFRQAAPVIKLEGSAWASEGAVGTARLAPTGATVAALTVVDGSTFDERPVASATSAVALTKAFAPLASRAGAVVSFGSGASTAIAIAQIAGLDGWGPRAAAIAIALDRVSTLDGGLASYCGSILTTRSFNVAPRAKVEASVSLGSSFAGITDREGSEATEALDCSSDLEELSCERLYPGQQLMCAYAGANGSCCRQPITDVRGYQQCTPGPEAGCPSGTVCSRAADTADAYVCVAEGACQAFGGVASPLPAGPIALGDVTAPATSKLGAAKLKKIAEEELAKLDPATLPTRRVTASLKLVTETTTGPIDYKIEARVEDAKTKAFIATVVGGARSNDPPTPEFLDEIAHAAVRSALKNVARAAGGS